MERASEDSAKNTLWPVTDWSGLGRAARAVGKDAEPLNQLILKYRVPLRAFLLSAFPGLEDQADLLLQDFSEDKILKDGWLGKADRRRGRFRDFLKTSLRNFVKDRLRGDANAPVPLDELRLDPPAEERTAEAFDLNWARTILAAVLERMERDCKAPTKDQPRRAQIWEVFRFRLLQPALEDAEPIGYEDLVDRLGIVSPADAQNMLATAKRIFARHLDAVVAQYETGGAAVKAEIAELRQFLSRLAKGKKAGAAQD